ncbi:MAG: M23 family metallopeptidase [Candidatus Omnitrophica bacterium]|nr:M23 family metallopeptidase [Candidatus Omnitrophota bacterium]
MKKLFFALLLFFPFLVGFGIFFLDQEYFLCPIVYKHDIIVRSDSRGNGFFGTNRNGQRTHAGVDLFGKIGTPVLASRSGWVIAAERNHGMGNFVKLRHRDNLITVYGHMSGINVQAGRYVRQGQVVGWVGKTGNANHPAMLPHLHFEVRKDGTPVDPLQYLD